jgi:hypothetical protein
MPTDRLNVPNNGEVELEVSEYRFYTVQGQAETGGQRTPLA